MRPEGLVLIHAVFGVFGLMAALWLFVEALNNSEAGQARIKVAGWITFISVWLTVLIGGYWYVIYYAPAKAVILAGPYPWAHNFFMETKEHLFFMMLLLATYLPIVLYSENLLANISSRNLVLVVCAIIVILGFVMEGSGAMIVLGEKCGLYVR